MDCRGEEEEEVNSMGPYVSLNSLSIDVADGLEMIVVVSLLEELRGRGLAFFIFLL